ncbi:excinuclease ABC subunit C [Pontibacter sp. KCTC 32443]|uniref:excinuclease ABC subunit C n=1 Tax=Pontibacter TaxID=323449 RepID=UPI00164E43B3|nr:MULTISPECIES: excinuclease ABC subunit C [Pontibacter]MBC5773380.1 excinuclease ABC subunit C [Pontibacter sp. KCTC 32443]
MQANNNHYFVYIFGGETETNLQIGMAGNIQQQLQQTQQNTDLPKKLVYYEHYDREAMALAREKQIKESSHTDNKRLIESMNPNWLDLSDLL